MLPVPGAAGGDRKKLQQAKAMLDEILKEDPRNPVAIFLRGWSFQQMGQPLDAIKTYELLYPEISELSGYAHFNEAILLEALNRNDDALAHYQKTIVENVAMQDAWRRLISLLSRTGDREGAKDTTLTALQVMPNDAQILQFKKELGIKD